jgi:hypothetical protein
MSSFGIMLGIVVLVVVGQALLWSWVLIERQRKVPDVQIFNWRELSDSLRSLADAYYKQFRRDR